MIVFVAYRHEAKRYVIALLPETNKKDSAQGHFSSTTPTVLSWHTMTSCVWLFRHEPLQAHSQLLLLLLGQ